MKTNAGNLDIAVKGGNVDDDFMMKSFLFLYLSTVSFFKRHLLLITLQAMPN